MLNDMSLKISIECLYLESCSMNEINQITKLRFTDFYAIVFVICDLKSNSSNRIWMWISPFSTKTSSDQLLISVFKLHETIFFTYSQREMNVFPNFSYVNLSVTSELMYLRLHRRRQNFVLESFLEYFSSE